MEVAADSLAEFHKLVPRYISPQPVNEKYFKFQNIYIMFITDHISRFWCDRVCDSKNSAIWQQDRVLSRYLRSITCLLLVEVIAYIVLDGITIPSESIIAIVLNRKKEMNFLFWY